MRHHNLSRRDFLKLGGLGLGALAFNPLRPEVLSSLPQFPAGERLGRVAVTPNFYSTQLKARPGSLEPAIRNLAQDEVVTWQRDVLGTEAFGGVSKRWAETPEGYVYASHLQPSRNIQNTPMNSLPEGKAGFWAEVTVPYVNLQIQNAAISPGVKYTIEIAQTPRLYYGQVVWIDQVVPDGNGQILYRFNESPGHGYGYGDLFLAAGSAFRPLTEADVAPINANVDPAIKRILVDATAQRQTLSCFEGNTEVYFCRISSGYDEQFTTPLGDQAVAWKIFSIHMAANTGSDSGYDTLAVPWPTFFNTNAGAAIHGAFWHNDFGVQRSHGCINVAPEDAKWIFRWTAPFISLDQGEARLEWPNVGGSFSTLVSVNRLRVPG
jgi:lipoprotein-anchoring transpeptidase ErfK/SrfK